MKKDNGKKRKGEARKPQRRPALQWHRAVIIDYATLIAWPNVERVEIGRKERKGKITSGLCVKIYITEKKRKPLKEEHLPKWAHVLVPVGKGMYAKRRIQTDVVWHAPPEFCSRPDDFLNPIAGGAMIGVPTRKAGTYTCVVANSQGQPFAVTAGHVVQGFQGRIAPGVQVLQPPTPSPTIPSGQSQLLGQTIDGFFGNTPQGFLDFALLQILPSRTAVSDALDSLPVRRQIMSSAFVINNAISVTKFGAFTGRTEGVFSAPVTSIVIGGIIVRNVLEFKGTNEALFGDQGDSGALVVSASPGSQGLIVGILFATMPPTPDAPSGRGFVLPFERLTGLQPA